MKKTSRSVITGIVTAVVLLAVLVSCSNLNIRKQASIIISFGNSRASISYQKSDTAYYTISILPAVQQPKRVEATQNSAKITNLDEGTYTLLVNAYNAKDELIAEGKAENIQVVIGETATATIQMAAKTYHEHDFATEWTTNAAYHWHAATCGDTEEVQDKAEHTFGDWITVTPATEENEGLKKRTCTVCNYEKTETIPLLNHTHTWASEWTYDESNHWHECTSSKCSEKDQFAAHTWDAGVVTTQPTCTTDGVKTYTCTFCDATKTEIIPAQGHVWGEYTYNNNATEEQAGTKTAHCENCGATDVLPANGPNTATYQFTETIQPAPEGYSGTMESAGETGRYVIFGDFPQTVAESGVTFNPRPEKNGYYVGSDGCYYEKVHVGSAYNNYYFNNRTMITQNADHYIKVEPIVWRVLTTEYDWDGEGVKEPAALLFSEKTLTRAMFYPNGDNRIINNITIYPNNYKYSTVRAYLNGRYEEDDTQEQTYVVDGKGRGFLQIAFTENAQNIINLTTVNNGEETVGYDAESTNARKTFVCENTLDKIFLLSQSEAINSAYGFGGPTASKKNRLLSTTDYYNTALVDYSGWWGRSPGSPLNSAFGSEPSTYAACGSYTINYFKGIAPALTVPVEELPELPELPEQ